MGVEFFPCSNPDCYETICDCDSFWNCEKCGYVLCDSCESKYVDNVVCPFCSKEIVTDTDLLTFLLKKLRLNKTWLVEYYKDEDGWEGDFSFNFIKKGA